MNGTSADYNHSGDNGMKQSLQVRKQQLVRDAIYDAAIDLFAVKGFDETTVEEVAQAAGVSRRSFFRYFASKDDLLAQNVLNYGEVLSIGVTACPSALTSLEVVRATVLFTVEKMVDHQRVRHIIEISERSPSAKQAHQSRMMEVEDSVSAAFASRLRNASNDDLKPRLLASLTLAVMNVTIIAWFRGESNDLSTAANKVFANLTRIVCEETHSIVARAHSSTGPKTVGPFRQRKSAKLKK
jgi:AcrR family transcriptional regulator